MPDVIANKYKIVREIARSNDVVYEAVDTTMGRRLAVKELVIPPNLTGQARRERIERFNREARATGRLAHPNIVTVYDYGEDGGRYFIAMEYLEGGTLRDAMQSRGALPMQEALDVASQVLAGLSHAHQHKVIHRDVKPDNIHILPGGQVKLTDFGIARLAEEASLTGEGQVFGTPSYMSPEQIEGKEIDHRTDLFSLAVVLYEMLSGRKPFTGDSVVTITYAIMHNEPPALTGISYGVEQVIRRALSKVAVQRYGSADEMRQALRNADSMPSVFMPAAMQTGLGITGLGGSSVPAGPYAGYGGQPAPYGVSIPPPGPGTAMGPTAYAPPPMPAPQMQTGGGPFVNWTTPGGAPPTYAPPPAPFAPRRSGPLLSQAAQTFLLVMLWAVLLGGLVLGIVLLFFKAYEQQRVMGTSAAVIQLNTQGKALYQKGQLESAAQVFRQAMARAERGTPPWLEARSNLAVTLNRLGVKAMQLRDFQAAEQYFGGVLDLYPSDADAQTDQDKQVVGDAHYNLGQVYDRTGDKDRALNQWQQSNGSSASSGSGGSAAPDTVLQASYDRARAYLAAGIQAYNEGKSDQARDYWSKAASEAPGTDVAMQAQNLLNQTASPPGF